MRERSSPEIGSSNPSCEKGTRSLFHDMPQIAHVKRKQKLPVSDSSLNNFVNGANIPVRPYSLSASSKNSAHSTWEFMHTS
jgi:hypothetical protein